MAKILISLPDELAKLANEHGLLYPAALAAYVREKVQENEHPELLLPFHPLELHLGTEVADSLGNPPDGDCDLMDLLVMTRDFFAEEMGLLAPVVHVRKPEDLDPNGYIVKINGIAVARNSVRQGRLLATDEGGATGEVEGLEAENLVYDMPAVWIEEDNREIAESMGYTVSDIQEAVATNFFLVIRQHAADLLTREKTVQLLELAKENAPHTVQEAESTAGVALIHRVLQQLLRECVGIRNLPAILEVISDAAGKNDLKDVVDQVRAALACQLCAGMADKDNRLRAVTLDERLEESLIGRCANDSFTGLSPTALWKLTEAVKRTGQRQMTPEREPLLITAPALRRAIRCLTQVSFPRLVIMSWGEIAPGFRVDIVGKVVHKAPWLNPKSNATGNSMVSGAAPKKGDVVDWPRAGSPEPSPAGEAPAVTASRARVDGKSAERWFEKGLRCLECEDTAEAMRWLRMAAERGYPPAQIKLGQIHEEGDLIPKDSKEALRWYRMAADQGEAQAQTQLGYLHADGEGIGRDYRESEKWFRLAAEQGDARAQNALGEMYRDGIGMGSDYAQAAQWFRLAAEGGDEDAEENLSAMRRSGLIADR